MIVWFDFNTTKLIWENSKISTFSYTHKFNLELTIFRNDIHDNNITIYKYLLSDYPPHVYINAVLIKFNIEMKWNEIHEQWNASLIPS